jgi:4'-phosphopantetheinyl transferase
MGAISLRPLLWSLDRSPAPLLRAWAPPAGEAGEASLPLLLLIDRRDAAGARAAPALRGLLGARELERLARFRQAADRERFLLGRGGLRWLLGTLLDCPAAELPLTEGSHGKPELRGGPQFNISHSGDLVLLAVHRQLPIGVDVEQQRPDLDWEAIARRVLPARELQTLRQLPPQRRAAGYLRAWCRLEAKLKARGDGFSALAALAAEEEAAEEEAAREQAAQKEAAKQGATQVMVGWEAGGGWVLGSGGLGSASVHSIVPSIRVWDLALPEGYGGAVALWQGTSAMKS